MAGVGRGALLLYATRNPCDQRDFPLLVPTTIDSTVLMAKHKPPAISGVSASNEAQIMTVYPSVACLGPGRAMGGLYDCIPVNIWGVRISHALFVLPTIPFALLFYFFLKVFGRRYVLTNRSIQLWKALGNFREKSVPLGQIAQVEVRQLPGQAFFKAADLSLYSSSGERLLVLEGVPYPDIFRQTIIEARDAQQQVGASLATIRARVPA